MSILSRRWKSRRLYLLTAIILAIAALAGVSIYRSSPAQDRHDTSTSSPKAALAVTTVTAMPVDLARTIPISGSIHAWQEIVISPEVGGYRVAEVRVDVGDHVKKGEELVHLSTALLEAEVATKEAALKLQNAGLQNARSALARAKALSAKSLLSDADVDKLNSDELSAKARVESAQADLDSSRLRLQFTRVTSPDDGVITSRSINVGQIAQAGGEMLRLLRQGRVEWRGEVPEARLMDMQPGQPVKITTADDTSYTGKVRIVAPTIASATRTGLVYVDIEADEHIRPGMFARGEIEIGHSRSIMVPLDCVINSDGYSYVYTVRPDQSVERRRVATGIVQADAIEITDGLVAGEVIVKDGAGFLKDGDVVAIGSTTQS